MHVAARTYRGAVVRPEKTAKEAYLRDKRDLLDSQKRPPITAYLGAMAQPEKRAAAAHVKAMHEAMLMDAAKCAASARSGANRPQLFLMP